MTMAAEVDGALAAQKQHDSKPWNTTSLGSRLAADGIAALMAGFVVAPVIAIIDKLVSPRPLSQTYTQAELTT